MNSSERKKLAEQLSAILNNPETPEDLYNAITDQVCFYSNFLDFDSAEMIEIALQAYEERGNGERPDITRTDGMSVIGGVQ